MKWQPLPGQEGGGGEVPQSPGGGLPNGRRVRSEGLAVAPESTPESRRSTRLFCLIGAKKKRMMHTHAGARRRGARKGAAPVRRLAAGACAAAGVASVHAGRVGAASGNGIGANPLRRWGVVLRRP